VIRLLCLGMGLLPIMAVAQVSEKPPGPELAVVAVLSDDRLLMANGTEHFVCRIVGDEDGDYTLGNCRPLALNLPIENDKARPISVFEEHGCRLTEAVAQSILPPLGFDRDATRALVGQLLAEGLMEVSGSTAILKTETCK